jgi:hypothetical protein
MSKKRTLNELRQVKEFGYNPPSPTKGLSQLEIDLAIERVKSNVYAELDLEEMIREEMIEEGLCPDQISDGQMHEAFTEVFEFCVSSLKYHYL